MLASIPWNKENQMIAPEPIPSSAPGQIAADRALTFTQQRVKIMKTDWGQRKMSMERARAWLARFGYDDRIQEFTESSATVELAAQRLGVIGARIAKTLSFLVDDGAVLIVAAGDVKIDNAKYKATFHTKAKMLQHDQVEPMTGHMVGGVCPFGVKEGVRVFLDESLKRFSTVFPAVGTAASAIELTIPELEQVSGYQGWVDVCKFPAGNP